LNASPVVDEQGASRAASVDGLHMLEEGFGHIDDRQGQSLLDPNPTQVDQFTVSF